MKRIISLVVMAIFALHTGLAYAALSDTVNVTATVGTGVSFVDILNTVDIAFGSVTPSDTDHRFMAASAMQVSYFAANSPWTIRVYTDNSPGDDSPTPEGAFAGLEGADGVSYMPLKVWNVNFGPGPTVPDPEVDATWSSPTEGWARIPEKDEHVDGPTPPADPFTWRRLTYTGAEIATPFDNNLATDAAGAVAQAYSTTLTVEIINQ
jgi:hypothetical protein